jgi:hypothetical protein
MTACHLPPLGWSCTRAAGHDGPCAAVPVLINGMSQEFLVANQESIDEALFDQIVNPGDQPDPAAGLSALGDGIAWAGFWVGVGLVLAALAWRFA